MGTELRRRAGRVPRLDLGGSHTGIHVCKHSSRCTLKPCLLCPKGVTPGCVRTDSASPTHLLHISRGLLCVSLEKKSPSVARPHGIPTPRQARGPQESLSASGLREPGECGPKTLVRAWGTSVGRQDAPVRCDSTGRLSPGGHWRDVCPGQKGQFVQEDRSDLCSGNREPSVWQQREGQGGRKPESRLGRWEGPRGARLFP